jgi:hypothetical protein
MSCFISYCYRKNPGCFQTGEISTCFGIIFAVLTAQAYNIVTINKIEAERERETEK